MILSVSFILHIIDDQFCDIGFDAVFRFQPFNDFTFCMIVETNGKRPVIISVIGIVIFNFVAKSVYALIFHVFTFTKSVAEQHLIDKRIK